MNRENVLNQIKEIETDYEEFKADGKFDSIQGSVDEAILLFLDWYGEKNKSTLAGWGLYYDLPLLRKEFNEFGLDYNKYFVGGGFDIRALGVYGN